MLWPVTNTKHWCDEYLTLNYRNKYDWQKHSQTNRMLIPFQAYPVASLARDARGTRVASLALCIGRKTFMTGWSDWVCNNCTHTDQKRTLPLTQECQGNLVLPLMANKGQRWWKRKKKKNSWSTVLFFKMLKIIYNNYTYTLYKGVLVGKSIKWHAK